MTFVKAVRSGARDADGNLPPEVWKPDQTSPTLSAFDNNSETRATVLAFEMRTRDGEPQAEITGNNVAGPLRTGTGGSSKPMIATVLAINENQRAEIVMTDIAHSITSGGGKPGQGYPAVLASGWQENHHAGETHTEQTTAPTTTKTQAIHSQQHGVRRLTPIECERLMGWPDNWTANSITGPQAESHRYRQCGNGVVANVTHWIGTRLHGAAS